MNAYTSSFEDLIANLIQIAILDIKEVEMMDLGLCAYPNEQCKSHGTCVVALGTKIGLWGMTDVSIIDHASLMAIARDYLKLETSQTPNDTIDKGTITQIHGKAT